MVSNTAAPGDGAGASSPATPIRILLVGDEGDASMLKSQFLDAGHLTAMQRAETPEAVLQALAGECWDVIIIGQDRLSDDFGRQQVLQAIASLRLDAPVIVLADEASEDTVFAAMRAGAHAVLGRHEPERLVPAVERELGEASSRREQRRVQDSLRESEARLRALADNIPGVVFRMGCDAQGMLHFHYLSEAAQMLFERSAESLVAESAGWRRYILDDDRESFEEALAHSAAHMTTLNWEGRIRLNGGEQKWINLRSSPLITESCDIVWEGVMWNITHSKRVEADLRESRSQLAALSNHLQRVKEEERERIARDVHDILGGDLVALKIELSLLTARIASEPARALERAHSMERMLDTAISTVGRVTRELRPGILKDFGLAA
ncbi:MAG: PAS domain-containing protein, partial [Zoogloea sp.]|nr:PAS domain-containing protein [Zoogloea sp.]